MPDPSDHSVAARVRRYYDRVAPFLESELANRGDLAFWEALVHRHAPDSVLELGCGTGRVTRVLADRCSRVVAVDVTPGMLARARRGLSGRTNVRLIMADMRRVRLRAAFDLVAAPDDPFVHLLSDVDRDRALETVARHLAPGGRFVLDAMWWTPAELAAARRSDGLRRRRTCRREDGSAIVVEEEWHADADGPEVVGHYRYVAHGRTVEEATFRGRRWTRREIEERLPAAGLWPTRIHGGYDGRTFDPAAAEALVVEARPRAPQGGGRPA